MQPPSIQSSTQIHMDLWNSSMKDSLQFQHRNPNIAIMEETFSTLSMPRCYKPGPVSSCSVEAGSSTSIVTLRVVGGEEKGSLGSETVKYGHETQRTRTRK
jgi:hypothetical protein